MPTLVITAGDPSGVGPEVILKALLRRQLRKERLILIGDESVFAPTARRLGLKLPRWRTFAPTDSLPAKLPPLAFIDCQSKAEFVPGRSSARAGAASLFYLKQAVRLWKAGRMDSLVTAPVTKWAVLQTLPTFVGHTEWLAGQTGRPDVVMMFASKRLRLVVLTRHIPLRLVSKALTRRLLAVSLRLTVEALRKQFGIARPRLALCGLNPHAAEGRPYSEEQQVMVPVLSRLRRQGIVCEGPFAADGFFAKPVAHDAVVCPYHDQGLIPFKMVARDRGCQLTLGLPFVRTSPDHGSALDIAGKGVADCGSMRYALDLAARLA